MKFLYLIFFFCSMTLVHAQPGDFVAIRKAQLQKVETALQNDPYNKELLWKRIDLVFRPHFSLTTKAGNLDQFQYRATAYPYYILDDLDYLIVSNSSVTYKSRQISLADFHLRRGQFFYKLGHTDYALNDYLTALTHKPEFKLKQNICLAIAAYYYTKEDYDTSENYQKALSYIDLVTPKENLTKPYVHHYRVYNDHFQREKIQLLKASQNSERYVTYLQCIAKKYFRFYQIESEKSAANQKKYSYSIRNSLRLGFDKLYEIALHFYENENYEKAKNIIENVIAFLPRNKDQYYYETYAYGNYFLLLSKIYRTNAYQNIPLEIDNLLEGFGDPTQGFPSQAKKYGDRLEELLALYPNEPKLHLAKAIYLKKVKYNKGHKNIAGNIFEYLQKSATLGLEDYRIWYLKAMLLHEEKRYEEALQNINKAQLLYAGHVNIYNLKLRLLHNSERANAVEITSTQSLLEAAKKREKVLIETIMEMMYKM